MPDDISTTVIYGLIGLFAMVLLYYTGITIISYVSPIISDMNPNSTVGVSEAEYDAIIDDLEQVPHYVFYIAFAFIFIFIAVKVLFKRESTSVYDEGGYY